MTLFKNIFSVAALLAAVSFSSFSASAQPVGQFVVLADYEDEYVTPTVEVNLDEPFVYDRDFFEMFAMFMDSATPYELKSGLEITSVTINGNSIAFNTTCDKTIALGLSFVNGDVLEQLRETMAQSVYQLLMEFGEDYEGDTVVEKMQSLGLGMSYNFYVQGDSTPVKSINISAQQIQQAGQNVNVALIER